MGYFSNGSEGDAYEREYCSKCIHNNDEGGCAVAVAHRIHNYSECNNPDSILHMLIPMSKDAFNEKCKMFKENL